MSTFTLSGADQNVLLYHLALYGLADILDDRGIPDVGLSWSAGRPTVHGDGLTPELVDDAVRRHIDARRIWTELQFGPDRRGLMSPRLSAVKDDAAWNDLQRDREAVLGELTDRRAWSDLRYLAALGEPCYWRFTPKKEPRQDDGASRLEMQPRNRGSEFVGNRLRPLTAKLLSRKPGFIAAGLDGTRPVDELGGKPDSVSATGLTTPGPVDNALVWCALWGIGQFPTSLRTTAPASTSGHIGGRRREWFYAPVWEGLWRTARLRSVLAARQLRDTASTDPQRGAEDLAVRAGHWLRARGVVGVLRFPIGRFGSDNAPERRALRAQPIPLGPAR